MVSTTRNRKYALSRRRKGTYEEALERLRSLVEISLVKAKRFRTDINNDAKRRSDVNSHAGYDRTIQKWEAVGTKYRGDISREIRTTVRNTTLSGNNDQYLRQIKRDVNEWVKSGKKLLSWDMFEKERRYQRPDARSKDVTTKESASKTSISPKKGRTDRSKVRAMKKEIKRLRRVVVLKNPKKDTSGTKRPRQSHKRSKDRKRKESKKIQHQEATQIIRQVNNWKRSRHFQRQTKDVERNAEKAISTLKEYMASRKRRKILIPATRRTKKENRAHSGKHLRFEQSRKKTPSSRRRRLRRKSRRRLHS